MIQITIPIKDRNLLEDKGLPIKIHNQKTIIKKKGLYLYYRDEDNRVQRLKIMEIDLDGRSIFFRTRLDPENV